VRFISLSVDNFGVFRGKHTFDLRPTAESGHQKRVVLFAGHNGAGKSSLFHALSLALYGPLATDDRTTRAGYSDHLLARFHRAGRGALVATEASVSVRFEYIRAGIPTDLVVTRAWQRNGSVVRETLDVFENGRAPDVERDEYPAWLEEFAPPGLASIIFFDAEKLEAFVTPEEHDQLLRDTLDRLLGLDVVKRLDVDLNQFILKVGGGRGKDHNTLRFLLLAEQASLEERQGEVNELEARFQQTAATKVVLTQELAFIERQIEQAGGTYAQQLPARRARLGEVNKELDQLSQQLQEMAGELLPFTLAPVLLSSLTQTLAQEGQARREHLALDVLMERVHQAQASLHSDEFWSGVSLSPQGRAEVLDRIVHALLPQRESDLPKTSFLHSFSDSEVQQIQQWAMQATQVVAPKAIALGQALKSLRAERARLERDMNRAPDEKSLNPLYEERKQNLLKQEINEEVKKKITEDLGAAKFKLAEQTRKHQKAVEEFRNAQAGHHRIQLAEKSQSVLKVYQQELVKRRLRTLEHMLVEEFNVLCRKERLLAKAHINSHDFSTTLFDYDGHALKLSDLSAGERQLYTLALLSAMRKVSGYQLPLLVDTPLGRLDEAHRERLVQLYFPRVSDQVLLFTTDSEFEAVMESPTAHREAETAKAHRG